MADHWAKESLKAHPDQRGRAERIDEFDALAVGALRVVMAVYSRVVLDRDARGAIPKRRNRVPGGPMGRAFNRDWPWVVKGHSIEPLAGEAPVLVQSHWRCTRCNCSAKTRGSLRVLGKRPCHGGRVRSRAEVSLAGNSRSGAGGRRRPPRHCPRGPRPRSYTASTRTGRSGDAGAAEPSSASCGIWGFSATMFSKPPPGRGRWSTSG